MSQDKYTPEQINKLLTDIKDKIDSMPTGDHERDQGTELSLYTNFIKDCAEGNFTTIEDIKKLAELLILTQNKGFLRW